MNYEEMQDIATANKLGVVVFENKKALSNGKLFEVGYVFINGEKILFCKNQSLHCKFYLCNEFKKFSRG